MDNTDRAETVQPWLTKQKSHEIFRSTASTVDIPNHWNPRAKQQPTGLIACGAMRRRPVRAPSIIQTKRKTSTQCVLVFLGAMEGTRTPGLLIRSQSLYPAELPTHTFRSEQDVFYHGTTVLSTSFLKFFWIFRKRTSFGKILPDQFQRCRPPRRKRSARTGIPPGQNPLADAVCTVPGVPTRDLPPKRTKMADFLFFRISFLS